jgi:hypothetical protein
MHTAALTAFVTHARASGFLEWMDAPGGQQSIAALDLVFDALVHAGVDARQRKIVWVDGERLSIEQSAERIHAEHPGVARDLIETHVLGWLESCVPESYSERELEPYPFEAIHGAWFDRTIPHDGKDVVRRSIARYVAAVRGDGSAELR